MTPRQFRFGIEAYTGLVIASVGLALAGLTWRLGGDPGIGPMAAPVAASANQPSDLRPLIALAPFGSANSALAATGPVDTTIKLKAIFMAIPVEASTVLIAGSDGKVTAYGIGAMLSGGVIDSIAPEQFVLRTAQGLQTIGFSPALGGAMSSNTNVATMTTVAPIAPAAPPGIPPPPTTAALGPSAPGVAGAAAIGTAGADGYRIGGSPPAALLAAGLQPGDVVTRLNGAPVDAGSSERDLAAKAMAAGSAKIEIMRDGRRVSLNLPLR